MEWNGIQLDDLQSMYPFSFDSFSFLLFCLKNNKITKITKIWYFTTSDTNIKKIKSNLIIKTLFFLMSQYQSFDIKILFYSFFDIKKTTLFFLIVEYQNKFFFDIKKNKMILAEDQKKTNIKNLISKKTKFWYLIFDICKYQNFVISRSNQKY